MRDRDIRLGSRQLELAEWAIEPMHDFWCTAESAWDREGTEYPETDLPSIKGNVLRLSPVKEINDDLSWRLREQFPNLGMQEPEEIARFKQDIESARLLADNIDSKTGA